MESLGIPVSWEGLGVAGLILFAILSILKGWLIPGAWVDRLLKDKDSQIDRLTVINEKYLAGQEPLVKLLQTMNDQAQAKENDS